jgi:hypothetical protein
MSRHLDGSPQPVDTVSMRWRWWFHLGCAACGHRAALSIGALALQHELPPATNLYRIANRLRCGRCGARPSSIDVRERRR